MRGSNEETQGKEERKGIQGGELKLKAFEGFYGNLI